MSRRLKIKTASPEETLAVGRVIARALARVRVVLLEGPLGAGKTVVAQGMCAELGVEEPVTSPTYTLQNEYYGTDDRLIIHVDAFRLGGADEFDDLGVLDRMDGDALLLVEWGDRVAEALPGALRVRWLRVDLGLGRREEQAGLDGLHHLGGVADHGEPDAGPAQQRVADGPVRSHVVQVAVHAPGVVPDHDLRLEGVDRRTDHGGTFGARERSFA